MAWARRAVLLSAVVFLAWFMIGGKAWVRTQAGGARAGPPARGSLGFASGAVVDPLPEDAGARSQYVGLGPRLDAAQDLARLGPEGLAALRAALADAEPATRALAALALLGSGDADEADERRVEELLGDADGSVRVAAGLSLLVRDTRLERSPSVNAAFLGEVLADAPEVTDGEAARVIALVLAADAAWAVPVLFRSPGLEPRAVRLLRAMVEDRDTRRDALEMLGRCGEPLAVADLDLSRFEEWSERRDAAIAFLRLGCRIDEALLVLADARVLDASGWTEDRTPVLPALRRSLAGQGPLSAWNALRIVRAVGPPAADLLPELLDLRATDSAPLVACALASIGPAAAPAIPWLLAESERGGECLLWADDVPSVGPPVLGLYRHGPRLLEIDTGFPKGAEPWPRDLVFLAAAARVASSHPDVVRTALRRLDDRDRSVRAAAALALSGALRLGDGAVEPIRARFVHDPCERVRAAAASALGRGAWGGNDDAAAALSEELEQGDAFGKEHAARALAMAHAEERLVEALESTSALTRAWAAAAVFDPQAERLSAGHDLEELAATMRRDQIRRSRAAAVIAACAEDPDPAARLVALGIVGRMPEYFRDTWEETLGAAASDPDGRVRLVADVAARYWEKRSRPWEAAPRGAPPPGLLAELAREMRGEGRPSPVDLVLEGADPGTLGVIAGDTGLLSFERWFAARALR